MDVWRSCARDLADPPPPPPLSPAGTRGDKLLSLHLGRRSTCGAISAAIPANGGVALFQIDQLRRAGRGLGRLLNQLWAITFSTRDLLCPPPPPPVIGRSRRVHPGEAAS